MDLVVEEEVEVPLTMTINLGELLLVEEAVEDAEFHLDQEVAVDQEALVDQEDHLPQVQVKPVKVAVVEIMEEKLSVVEVEKVVHPVKHQMQEEMVLEEKDLEDLEGQQVQTEQRLGERIIQFQYQSTIVEQ